MSRRFSARRLARPVATLAAVLLLAVLSAPGVADARTVRVSDQASMHLVRATGARLYEVGTAVGTLPGRLSGTFYVGATVTASLTL
ncbi:MAG TPA: hypothetical protein VFS37_02960, partial [Conexibacter sp.]|nr:hypothetical protein [Conexibacter sp.]